MMTWIKNEIGTTAFAVGLAVISIAFNAYAVNAEDVEPSIPVPAAVDWPDFMARQDMVWNQGAETVE